MFGSNVMCNEICAGEITAQTLAGLVEPLLARAGVMNDGPALQKVVQSIAAAAVHTNSCTNLLASSAVSQLPAKRFLTLLRSATSVMIGCNVVHSTLRCINSHILILV